MSSRAGGLSPQSSPHTWSLHGHMQLVYLRNDFWPWQTSLCVPLSSFLNFYCPLHFHPFPSICLHVPVIPATILSLFWELFSSNTNIPGSLPSLVAFLLPFNLSYFPASYLLCLSLSQTQSQDVPALPSKIFISGPDLIIQESRKMLHVVNDGSLSVKLLWKSRCRISSGSVVAG